MVLLEWAGCVFGVFGAGILAINDSRWSRYGWLLFLASNVFWIGYAWIGDAPGLLMQQCFFTVTSLLGIYRWVLNADPDLVLMARNQRQKEIAAWTARTFGARTATCREERIRRFADEAIELAQAEGMSEEDFSNLVRYVYSRPAGEPPQEVGGVAVTLMAYCETAGMSVDELEQREIARILAKDADYFRARQNAKALAGIAMASTHNAAALAANQATS